ncbi:MFS transporter [Saccharothrix yanglingensis]|uniref:MFS transporter n=1 Tax=Saccharothrix yanglingensis TaxID=659496 RepID=A0ABU0WYD5_9PSEU|nr:MFS transporter [Saccharothrix yanglingensis]MDQ2584872.1 MFS transporter [Saccharothrix yanglingensis]
MTVDVPGRERRTDDLLRSHRGFRLLFAADAISRTGSQVTLVALPLVAVLVLHASPQQVGLLVASSTIAFLVVALPAGVWVDRLPQRPVMVAAELIRALALVSVPVTALFGVLSLVQLYVVALVIGFGNVFFDVAQQSYVSRLLGKDRLQAAFSKLEVTGNGSLLVGSSAGGVLVQLITSSGAVAFNAACHLVSAGLLGRIRPREPEVLRLGERPRLRREITTGMRYVMGQPILRRVVVHGMIALLFEYALLTVQPLLLVGTLGLQPAVYGLVTAAVAVGGVVGSVLANRVISKLGIARTLWLPFVVTFPLLLVMPLVGGGWLVALYPLGYAAYIGGSAVQNVAQLTYRQAICPPELHGRMNSTMRFLMWGMMPVGGLLGGFLVQAVGDRNALWVCVVGMLASVLPMLGKSVFRLPRDAGIDQGR